MRVRSRPAPAATASQLSENVEMYLETIYELTEQGGRARTKDVAHGWRVGPSSATEMIQRLAAAGLVEHEPYHGVELTRRGKALAKGVVRKHRLLECFLLQDVGLEPKLADEHACEMEHVLPAPVEAWFCRRLGHPTATPAGLPIPPGPCCRAAGKAQA